MAGLVLVDGDDLPVEQDLLDGVAHGAHVVPGQQRRCQHAPQAHVSAVLGVGHAAVADLEHVGIVPVARAGILLAAVLVEADVGHGVPAVADVAGCPPQVAAHTGAPLADVEHSILAETVHHRPARRAQREAHLLVGRSVLFLGVHARGGAPIVLQVIDAPGGPRPGVLLLVTVAGGITRAGQAAGTGVDADFQSLGVDVAGQRLHVGELFVGQDIPVGVAAGFPRVVDIDVDVARVAHAAGGDGVGHFAHALVVHPAGEFVPTVPAHRRGERQPIGRQRLHRRQRLMRGQQVGGNRRRRGDPLVDGRREVATSAGRPAAPARQVGEVSGVRHPA